MLPSNAGSGYTKTCSLPHRCAQQQTNAFTHTQTQTILHNLPFIRSSCPVFIKCQNSLSFSTALSHTGVQVHTTVKETYTQKDTHTHTQYAIYTSSGLLVFMKLSKQNSLSLSIYHSLSLSPSLSLSLSHSLSGWCVQPEKILSPVCSTGPSVRR